jgi:hypothetical protein
MTSRVETTPTNDDDDSLIYAGLLRDWLESKVLCDDDLTHIEYTGHKTGDDDLPETFHIGVATFPLSGDEPLYCFYDGADGDCLSASGDRRWVVESLLVPALATYGTAAFVINDGDGVCFEFWDSFSQVLVERVVTVADVPFDRVTYVMASRWLKHNENSRKNAFGYMEHSGISTPALATLLAFHMGIVDGSHPLPMREPPRPQAPPGHLSPQNDMLRWRADISREMLGSMCDRISAGFVCHVDRINSDALFPWRFIVKPEGHATCLMYDKSNDDVYGDVTHDSLRGVFAKYGVTEADVFAISMDDHTQCEVLKRCFLRLPATCADVVATEELHESLLCEPHLLSPVVHVALKAMRALFSVWMENEEWRVHGYNPALAERAANGVPFLCS